MSPKELEKLQDRIDKNLAALEDMSIDLKQFDDRPAARQNEPSNNPLGAFLSQAQHLVSNAISNLNLPNLENLNLPNIDNMNLPNIDNMNLPNIENMNLPNLSNLLNNPLLNNNMPPTASEKLPDNSLIGTDQNLDTFLNNLNSRNTSNLINLLRQIERPNAAQFISRLTQNVTEFINNLSERYNSDFDPSSLPNINNLLAGLDNIGRQNEVKSPGGNFNIPAVSAIRNQLANLGIPNASGIRDNVIQRLSNLFVGLSQNNPLNNHEKQNN